jgi:hypothetical protein
MHREPQSFVTSHESGRTQFMHDRPGVSYPTSKNRTNLGSLESLERIGAAELSGVAI